MVKAPKYCGRTRCPAAANSSTDSQLAILEIANRLSFAPTTKSLIGLVVDILVHESNRPIGHQKVSPASVSGSKSPRDIPLAPVTTVRRSCAKTGKIEEILSGWRAAGTHRIDGCRCRSVIRLSVKVPCTCTVAQITNRQYFTDGNGGGSTVSNFLQTDAESPPGEKTRNILGPIVVAVILVTTWSLIVCAGCQPEIAGSVCGRSPLRPHATHIVRLSPAGIKRVHPRAVRRTREIRSRCQSQELRCRRTVSHVLVVGTGISVNVETKLLEDLIAVHVRQHSNLPTEAGMTIVPNSGSSLRPTKA